jgi:hypothetical protein
MAHSFPSALQGFSNAAAAAVCNALARAGPGAAVAPTWDPVLDVKGRNAKLSGSFIRMLDGRYHVIEECKASEHGIKVVLNKVDADALRRPTQDAAWLDKEVGTWFSRVGAGASGQAPGLHMSRRPARVAPVLPEKGQPLSQGTGAEPPIGGRRAQPRS